MEWIVDLLAKLLAVTAVLTLHEFAHAFVAYKCGDPTAKWAGRMTLNPARHFDPLGLLCFVFAGFGWAKPVPVNENNFKHYTRGSILTSSAGVIVNYLSAFLFYPLLMLSLRFYFSSAETLTYGHEFLYYLTHYLYSYSLCFCAFNLLPFYPLDGFRVVEAASKRRGAFYRFLRKYGYYILLGLIAESYLCEIFYRLTFSPVFVYIDLLGYIMSFATSVLSVPVTWVWNFVFA